MIEKDSPSAKRHSAFIDEYLSNGFNGTNAYKAVYQGIGDRSANVNASKLLSKPEILAEIDARLMATAKKSGITRQDLVDDLIRIKDANIKTSPSFSLKAIELIAKILGYNEPDKLDITSKQISITLNINEDGQAKNVLANPDKTFELGPANDHQDIIGQVKAYTSHTEPLDDGQANDHQNPDDLQDSENVDNF